MGKRKPVSIAGGTMAVTGALTEKRQLTIPDVLLQVAGIHAPCSVVMEAASGSGEIVVKCKAAKAND